MIIARSEFHRLGLEIVKEFYAPLYEKNSKPHRLIVSKGKERYILEKIVPSEVLDKDMKYKVVDYYEVRE